MIFHNILNLQCHEDYQNLHGASLYILVSYTLDLYKFYIEKKFNIPGKSLWFKRIYRFKDWFTVSNFEVNIAIETVTPLRPEEIADYMWFEDHIEGIVTQSIRTLFERGDYRNALNILSQVQSSIELISERFAVDESLHLFRAIKAILLDFVRKIDLSQMDARNEESKLRDILTIVRIFGLSFINILLRFSRGLKDVKIEEFEQHIARINWRKTKTIYSNSLPHKVLEQLENLKKGLKFEIEIEKEIISPEWYRIQLAAFGFVIFISESVEEIVKELEVVFVDGVKDFISEEKYISVAELIQSGLEACHKFEYHIENIKECFEKFNNLRRAPDIPWPKIEWDRLRGTMTSVKENLITSLGGIVPHIVKFPSSEHWTDYLGYAYYSLLNECFFAMESGNERLFETVFSDVFDLHFEARERLQKKLADYDRETQFIYCTGPLVDMLEISGYAILFTELNGKHYRRIVEKTWDKYFGLPETRRDLKLIAGVFEYRHSFPSIFPRDFSRQHWEQRYRQKMVNQNLITEEHGFYYDPFNRELPKHKSPIIRAMIKNFDSFSPKDVFFVEYLLKYPELKEFDLPRQIRSLIKRLEEEKKRDLKKEGGNKKENGE